MVQKKQSLKTGVTTGMSLSPVAPAFLRFPYSGKTIFSRGNNDGIMNEIQYVYDAGGHKKSVIVPVELWERTLQVQKPRTAPCNPQEYYGIYRDRIKNPQETARALRNEWNRG